MNDKACKHFSTILKSRPIWVRFVHKTQSQPHISKMEEPLEDYTTQELKDWTVRRHKARQCYRSVSRVTTRHYIPGTDDAEASVLLPGGRWLLFASAKYPGNICYADCDALRPEAQSLIVLEDVTPDRIRTQFVIWRDTKSPRLTLRVAILYWHAYDREFVCETFHHTLTAKDERVGVEDDDRGYQTHFCKIDLVGHDSSAKLVAEPLHRYQGSIPNMGNSLEGIRGQYFYQLPYIARIGGMAPRTPGPPDHSTELYILNYENGSSAANEVTLVDFYQHFYNVSPNSFSHCVAHRTC